MRPQIVLSVLSSRHSFRQNPRTARICLTPLPVAAAGILAFSAACAPSSARAQTLDLSAESLSLYDSGSDAGSGSGVLSAFTTAQSYTITSGSLTIVINAGSGLSGNSAALAAFNRAAAEWSSQITNNITVTINADLTSTGFSSSNIIGQTSTVNLTGSYSTIYNALEAKSGTDSTIAALPNASQFTASLPSGYSLSGNLLGTKAELKALGFTGLDTQFGTADATITFNSAFSFDYDNSDGVTAGTEDFQTVAAHEIGHALGFNSSVDTVDVDLNSSVTSASITPSVLDLYRFSSATVSGSGFSFKTSSRDLIPGDADVTDAGNSGVYGMSTGVYKGDGNQASHWKDDSLSGYYIGLMDPTLSYGTTETVGSADLTAMRLLGYSVAAAPEPGSVAFVGIAALLPVISSRRVRRRSPGKSRRTAAKT